MNRKYPHFAIPEIYGDSLSYYELLRKLVETMNAVIENYDTIPDQIAEAVANLDASQLFSTVLNQLIHSIATDNTKSANAVKVYKKHDLLYATFNDNVNLYESLIDFSTGTATELIPDTNIREVNISELFIELRKLIEGVTSVANENSAEIATMHNDITEQDNEISTLRTMISSPYNFKGDVDNISALPASGEVNDTYYVKDVKYKVTWTGSAWVQSSLSEADYQTELSELKSDLDEFEKTSRKKISSASFFQLGVILSTGIVYNENYIRTSAIHFDEKTTIIINGNSPRYGKFADAGLTNIVEYKVLPHSGIDYEFELDPNYYYCFSFQRINTGFNDNGAVYIRYPFVLKDEIRDFINRLYGKTVYNFGDSLMYGHHEKGMLDDLCYNNGMTLTKYAVNGATILGSSGLYNIENQVLNASDTVPDFIVFDGLMNDDSSTPNYTTKLGTLSDNFVESNLDTNTFYGAMEHLIYTIRNKYMTSNVIFVCCHKTPSRDKVAQDTLQKAVRECCEKWSIPYVDIYNEGQINCYIDSMRNTYSYNNQGETSGGNGTHLTGAGYNKWYAPLIKAKMLELLS